MQVRAQEIRQSLISEWEDKVIGYSEGKNLRDPVALLAKDIQSGRKALAFEPKHGYLESLMMELGVKSSTQSLVFSKTSSQVAAIGPKTPRALYFNDSVYLGWTQKGKFIDITSVDPEKGPIFYTLEQTEGKPKFERKPECMQCHLGPKTLNVPGLVVRSVYPAPNGYPLGQVLGFVSGHSPAIKDRWGGWYVTGLNGKEGHLGNVTVLDKAHETDIEARKGSNLISLKAKFDTSKYLSAESDIVGLMVMEHQLRMQNMITQANYETRYALAERAAMKEESGPQYEWTKQRIANAGEALLGCMLFRDETPLPDPVKGGAGFINEFQKLGVRDSKGRSLRQLDLKSRLFRYPCSYLVYSPAFDELPKEMRDYLWGRLVEILSGKDETTPYKAMSVEGRQAVLEILRDTKPEFRGRLRKS